MSTISLPSAFAEILRRASGPVQLIDEHGKVIGNFAPGNPISDDLTPDELDEIKRRMRSPGPRYSTEQVINYLDSKAIR